MFCESLCQNLDISSLQTGELRLRPCFGDNKPSQVPGMALDASTGNCSAACSEPEVPASLISDRGPLKWLEMVSRIPGGEVHTKMDFEEP